MTSCHNFLSNKIVSTIIDFDEASFYIGEPSFLGASRDGIVEMADGLKIIEIKCPYSVRDMTIEHVVRMGSLVH